jgi:hypothetical protein
MIPKLFVVSIALIFAVLLEANSSVEASKDWQTLAEKELNEIQSDEKVNKPLALYASSPSPIPQDFDHQPWLWQIGLSIYDPSGSIRIKPLSSTYSLSSMDGLSAYGLSFISPSLLSLQSFSLSYRTTVEYSHSRLSLFDPSLNKSIGGQLHHTSLGGGLETTYGLNNYFLLGLSSDLKYVQLHLNSGVEASVFESRNSTFVDTSIFLGARFYGYLGLRFGVKNLANISNPNHLGLGQSVFFASLVGGL